MLYLSKFSIFYLCLPQIFRPIPRIMPKIQDEEATETNVEGSERPRNVEELEMHNGDDQRRKPMFFFSVDYILNKAGETNAQNSNTDQQNSYQYDWLYCTRFKPPKLDSK